MLGDLPDAIDESCTLAPVLYGTQLGVLRINPDVRLRTDP
jgi:hypothetical protein